MSLWQTFNALTNGAMLYIVAKDHRIDPMIISQHIISENISVTCATPSEYLCWLRYGSTDGLRSSKWRHAIAGGEQITKTHLAAFYTLDKFNLRLFNGYGPSEVTIISSLMELLYDPEMQAQSDSSGRYPVGYTTRNCSVYIIGENKELLPPGFTGEIFIGGPGVAAGYLGNEKLTRERFVPDAFASPEQISKGFVTMYKTGDRGRFRFDGALIVEGRIDGDTEVKLRGIRIDLQDVEKAIQQSSDGKVLDVIVSMQGDPQYLVAHLVLSPDIQAAQTNTVWNQIYTSLPLPKHMRPSVAVPVTNFPITDHGKVDRRAVAMMTTDSAVSNLRTDDKVQLTINQYTLRNIWAEVIGRILPENTNSGSDFFLVGGNSGLLVRLQRAVRNTFSVVIPLMQLFESSTLKAMTALIKSSSNQESINWDTETAIDRESVLEQARNITRDHGQKKASKTGFSVLLTGSSGNIGSAVLRRLTKDPRVGKVHCIAIRSSEADLLAKLALDTESADKVSVHQGDLSIPLFGLSAQEFASLATTVDSIVHCGAQRSFWDYYHTLRDVNVTSVREMILFAAVAESSGYRVPIHFASSGSVQDLLDSGSQPSIDGREGYITSKWAAETILANAATELGTKVVLHRLGAHDLPVSTMETVEAESSLKDIVLTDFVKYSNTLQAVPEDSDAQSWSGTMGFVPLNEVARMLSSAAISIPSTSGVEILRYSARVRLSASEIATHVNRNCVGKKEFQNYERIPVIEWVGRAKAQGWSWVFVGLELVKGSQGIDSDELLLKR